MQTFIPNPLVISTQKLCESKLDDLPSWIVSIWSTPFILDEKSNKIYSLCQMSVSTVRSCSIAPKNPHRVLYHLMYRKEWCFVAFLRTIHYRFLRDHKDHKISDLYRMLCRCTSFDVYTVHTRCMSCGVRTLSALVVVHTCWVHELWCMVCRL